jgi:hypothetical protein
MSSPSTSRTRQFISRISTALAEMSHAQRRLFELQTGTSKSTRRA